MEEKFPSDSDSQCQKIGNPSLAGHKQKSWTKAVSVFLALGKPPRHCSGLPCTLGLLNQNSPVVLPTLLPHDHTSQHPQVFSMSRLTEIQCVGCAPNGQAPLVLQCSSTTTGSSLMPDHGMSLLGSMEPHREHHSSGTCGILIVFLSYTTAQEPFATFLLLLYQKMLPSSAGEGRLTAFHSLFHLHFLAILS